MTIKFILGKSGTGKTTHCISEVVAQLSQPDDETPLLMLVPEQATYQTERAVLSKIETKGFTRLQILSFERLRLMLLGPQTSSSISRIGRDMLMHRILRQNAKKLQAFSQVAHAPGLAGKIAQFVTELYQHANTPESLDDAREQLSRLAGDEQLQSKLADIKLLLTEYAAAVESKFLDVDLELARTIQTLRTSPMLKNAKLWIDGFAGFTGSEFALLRALLDQAEESTIALCLDPNEIDTDTGRLHPDSHDSIFLPTQQSYQSLLQMIRELKLPVTQPVVLKQVVRFKNNPTFAHIETELSKLQSKKSNVDPEALRVVAAAQPRSETKFVAEEIAKLVRDNNLRYRDIAVIASDSGKYESYIKAWFEQYQIPFFIDRKKPLSHHPLIGLLNTVGNILEKGYSHSDIFAFLKSDLTPLDDEDVFLLENYSLAHAPNHQDWCDTKAWNFQDRAKPDFDEQKINLLRMQAIDPIVKLQTRIGESKSKPITASEFVRILFEFLNDLQAVERIDSWIEQAAAANQWETADEHRQAYSRFVDTLDELVAVFEELKMPFAEYWQILLAACSQMSLAFIPPGLDQVLVGSIERSRHPELKAVFLLGTSQHDFPAPQTTDSILTEQQRTLASQAGLDLAPSLEQSLLERKYLAYIAFSRASEKLIVTYPLADDENRPVVRSEFVDELFALFENLKEENRSASVTQPQQIYDRSQLTQYLCESLGADTHSNESNLQSEHILSALQIDKSLQPIASFVNQSLQYENIAKLQPDRAAAFFAKNYHASASQLQTFATCPFKYFARNLLRLNKRREAKIEPLDIGSFLHAILEKLVGDCIRKKNDLTKLTREQLLEAFHRAAEYVMKNDSFIARFISHRTYNASLVRSAVDDLESLCLAMVQTMQAGAFRPFAVEVSFNNNGSIPPLKLKLPSGETLEIFGRIDRIDLAEKNGNAVVIDYKSSATKQDWKRTLHGLDLQLLVYLLALRDAKVDHRTLRPVGAFYLPMLTPSKLATPGSIEQRRQQFLHKARGIFDGDYASLLDKTCQQGRSEYYGFSIKKDGDFGDYNRSDVLLASDYENLLKLAETIIVSIAADIRSGRIDVAPYRIGTESPCARCDFSSFCRFDEQINTYRFLDSPNKQQVLERAAAHA